jgi:hypothetical protein
LDVVEVVLTCGRNKLTRGGPPPCDTAQVRQWRR